MTRKYQSRNDAADALRPAPNFPPTPPAIVGQTIIRNGRVYHEYTPQDIDAARLAAEYARMQASGHHKSTHGAVDTSAFIPDLGRKTLHHKAHG